MTPITSVEYSVCQTCYLFAAGYDAHELGYTPSRTPLALITEPGPIVATTDDESFEWYACEGCGDTLGGDRYTVVAHSH